MELLLWRWSTAAQITSALMIAVFFVVLSRSMRRLEMRPWTSAWLFNFSALLMTVIFWFAQPKSKMIFFGLRAGYFFGKTMFVALLCLGAWGFVRHQVVTRISGRIAAAMGLFAIIAGLCTNSVDGIGAAQSLAMALLFGVTAVILLTGTAPGSGWLITGSTLRALLAAIEAAAYTTRLVPGPWSTSPDVGIFLAVHSSLDTAAEWMIALGCVLTVYWTIQQELMKSNDDLLAAKGVLQELVDHDSLTGLANRRTLPAVLRQSISNGATILFFDLNDFKIINDAYGHHVGDECLKRFAHRLEANFHSDDHVIRYGGDEFIVVSQDVTSGGVQDRISLVREQLKFDKAVGPRITFSVGSAQLAKEGDPDAAFRAADEAMYLDKAGGKGRRQRFL